MMEEEGFTREGRRGVKDGERKGMGERLRNR